MTQTIFSAGSMFGQSTASGVGPDQFGLLQSCSIEFARDTKDLFGEYQFPEVIASGQSRITGRAAFARIYGAVYADLFFGESISTGNWIAVQNEVGTVAGAGSPAVYSVTVSNSANWTEDLGVTLTSTGRKLTYAVSSPASGQYSVSAGVYTFNVAQSGAGVKISYLWSDASTGKKFTINNQLMGVTPIFSIILTNPGRTQSGSAPFSLVLNKCTASRLTIPTRMGEFAIPEFEFMGFADDSQVIGTLSTTE